MTAEQETAPAAPSPDPPDDDPVFVAFCQAGLWPGLGRTTAARLPEAGIIGPDDVSGHRLRAVAGVTPSRADRLATTFAQARPAYDVVAMLVPAALEPRWASGLVAAYGDAAAATLAGDPWRLLESPGVAPAQADRLARHLLGASAGPDDPRRGAAITVHLLGRSARDGHTVVPAETVAAALAGFSCCPAQVAVKAGVDDGRLLAFPGPEAGGPPLLSLARYGQAEVSLAEGIARLVATAEPLCPPEAAPVAGLDPAQAEAVRLIAQHGVSVLTGGPGTGKSRTVAAVVELVRRNGLTLALAAPTGRAAKRLEELTSEEATTLHRLLGAQGTDGGFSVNEEFPLEVEVVVVDEASMLDVELASALLEACQDGTHLLFVGDPAQLPSIGPGRVLGDLIDSGAVPVTELTTLHRQAAGGTIARLATAVRGGELPPIEDPTREVVVVGARDGAEAAHRVVQLVTDSIPRALGIPAAEVQVVTPVHRGPAGTVALNAALKKVLNPGTGERHGFDVGDRVVATANHYDLGFANGEVGVVTGLPDGGGVEVTFAGLEATVTGKALGDLVHGWALTVHRAQGSEWPAVVTVAPAEAGGMLSRPLVYTAFTRAQRHLSVVHSAGGALRRAVAAVAARPRRTRLQTLLSEVAQP